MTTMTKEQKARKYVEIFRKLKMFVALSKVPNNISPQKFYKAKHKILTDSKLHKKFGVIYAQHKDNDYCVMVQISNQKVYMSITQKTKGKEATVYTQLKK